MFFVIYTSFQIVGAILLLINTFSTKREKILARFIGRGPIDHDREHNIINYNHISLIETYKEAILTKFSFLYILIGYILTVFDTQRLPTKTTIISITLISLTLYFIAQISVNLIIKYNANFNKPITTEELKEYHLEADSTEMTKEEIDEMFNES